MRSTSLSYIGSEDDIVASFVEHTLRFADHMIIVSTAEGQTRETLVKMQQDGLPMHVICHEPVYHDQHEVLSSLLMQAASDADWIVLLDADEFVTGDIRSALQDADRTRPHALAWKTYVPTSQDDEAEGDVRRRMRYRRSEEQPQFTKVVIPAAMITSEVTISQGNHAVIDANGNRFEGELLPDVSLAHFPVRSSTQMQAKIDRSWPAVVRNPARLSTEATHWKTLHERFAGQTMDARTLTEIALRYATSPDALLPTLVEDPIS